MVKFISKFLDDNLANEQNILYTKYIADYLEDYDGNPRSFKLHDSSF